MSTISDNDFPTQFSQHLLRFNNSYTKMRNNAVKHFITIILMLVFINRGFFVSSADEMKRNDNEINSVVEWLIEIFTGENNNFDEDGDSQSDHNCVKISQHDFTQQVAKIFELANLFSINKNNFCISKKENLPPINFFDKIDKPPEV